MCGCYQLLEALQLLLPIDMPPVPKFKNRYNIAPHQNSWFVRLRDDKPVCEEFEWGFRPSWLKDKNKHRSTLGVRQFSVNSCSRIQQ